VWGSSTIVQQALGLKLATDAPRVVSDPEWS
jgi:hypothetical protein